MNRSLTVARLHLNKWNTVVLTPLGILGIVMVVTIIIQIAILRATGMDANSPEYVEGARWNQAILWSLPGFLVYYGVQAVSTTYPFGLALGFTRRDYIAGTMIANMLHAVYITVLLLALLGLEFATNHWFVGAYVLDVNVVGAGDPLVLGVTAFLGVLFCLTVGGVFAAVWVRFGPKGPTILGLGLGLVLALSLLALAPQLGEIFGAITRGGLALAAVAIILVSLVGTWFAMRRASVR
ncbi:hypothetical protein MUN78_00160 [Leucobacter allii]|uniref:ABC transporter permease n=1 Tax=Leucobacter allii TaxID=2932247 RepID=A0ABY4FM04_9MICO|nr:hypothetical protein [Leucobacter allii]UOQ57295.1 hypothetical protein MUN78_00160 [Leucobacter allii]UOR01744.1 hypothetical protein MUN77_16815 [Leucobacter allii]